MKRPEVLYPTVVRGVIHGPIRCESIDGSEMWVDQEMNPDKIEGFRFINGRLMLMDFKPFEMNGKTWCVSHLQKRATYFSLLYDPFIYHHWVGKPQQQDVNGNWIPGSEKGNLWLGGYWRTPGWRWQIPDAVSEGTPWIFSGGRIPGTHLD